MGKKFAQKLANLLLTFVMVFSCLFIFSACDKDDDTPPAEATITSISVATAESSNYTLAQSTIELNYNKNKRYKFEASDFVVTATKSDNTTAVLTQKTDTTDGYTLDVTNVPTTTPTPVGEYKLTFGYTGVSNVEIGVKVNKGVIDVSGVTLEDKSYNGEVQTLTTADIKNLPEDVTAEFVSGNSGQNSQTYEAELSFTYTGTDADSIETIPNRTISWKINKADYNVSSVSWTGGSEFTYTGTKHTVTITGNLPTGVTIKGYLNNEYTNVGTYTASVQFNFDAVNYNAPAVPTYTWKINKAQLTVTAKDKAITFTDEPANNGVEYNGFVNGESENTEGLIKGALAFDYSGYLKGTTTHKTYVVGQDAGTYPIVPAGISADNYEITFVNGTLTVSAKTFEYSDITFTYDASSPFTYNGQIQKPTITGVSTYVNYTIQATTSGATSESKDAGTYTATFTPTPSGNYTFSGTAPTVQYVINKKALTITANDKTINFGEKAANAGVRVTGLVEGESLSEVTTGELVYSYGNYTATSNVGKYPITVTGLSAKNYDITYQPGELTVAKIQLQYSIITIGDSTETVTTYTYDGEAHTFSMTGKPDYVKESLVYKDSNNQIVTAPKDAGTYTATFAVTDSANYEFLGTAPTKTLVINKKALTITAENKTITWGDAVPTYTATYSGFVTGETEDTEGIFTGTLSLACTYTADSNAGSYNIVPSGLSAKNYEITYVDGTLTVNKVTYNCSDLSWKLNGEDVVLESGGYALFEYNGQAQKPTVSGINSNVAYSVTYNIYNYSEKTLGNEIQNPTVVGDYIATLTITASDNYEFDGTFAPLVYGIAQKHLTETDKAKMGFVVKKVNKADSTDVETMTFESISEVEGGYSLTAYLEQGYEYLVSFKNEFDEDITFTFKQNDGYNDQDIDSLIGDNNAITFSSICNYTFTATAGGEVLQYYVDCYSSYTLKFSIESIVKEIEIFYLNDNYDSSDEDSSEYESSCESFNNYSATTIDVYNLLTDIIAVYSDDDGENPSHLCEFYSCEFAIDAENTTAVDVGNYSCFENVIYLIIRTNSTATSHIVGVYPIKINLNIKLNSGNNANHTISVSSTDSNITTSENPFTLDLTYGDKTVIEALGASSSVKLEKYIDDDTRSEELVSSVTLESGTNKLRIYISFTIKISNMHSATYYYETDIAIICSVSSNNFNISYTDSSDPENSSQAYDNELYVNVYSTSNFVGENANTSIKDIVDNISISSKTQEEVGENESTYDVDEDSKTIECVNGKVYVVFDVTENEAQGGGV